jgi:methyl-accepting chemotaxis protein
MITLASLNSRFKIGTRINFGFMTVLALLLVVAAVGYFGLGGSRYALDEYVRISDNSLKVIEADRNLTNMRRNALAYVQSGDEASLKRVRDMGKTVRADLVSTEANTHNPERHEMLKKLVVLVDQFTADFELIVKLRGQRDHAVNEVMNPLDAKLRSELGAIVDTGMKAYDMEVVAYGGLAQEGLMQVRLNLYRFLLEPDDKLFAAAEQEFTKLTASLQRLHEAMQNPEQRAKVRQVMKETPEYLAVFRDAVKLIKETNRVSGELNGKLSTDIAQSGIALRASQAKALAELKASSEASVASAIVLALTASGIALVVGLFFAWLIGRGITRPVVSLKRFICMFTSARAKTQAILCSSTRVARCERRRSRSSSKRSSDAATMPLKEPRSALSTNADTISARMGSEAMCEANLCPIVCSWGASRQTLLRRRRRRVRVGADRRGQDAVPRPARLES